HTCELQHHCPAHISHTPRRRRGRSTHRPHLSNTPAGLHSTRPGYLVLKFSPRFFPAERFPRTRPAQIRGSPTTSPGKARPDPRLAYNSAGQSPPKSEARLQLRRAKPAKIRG